MIDDVYKKELERMRKLCSTREFCVSEVRTRLLRRIEKFSPLGNGNPRVGGSPLGNEDWDGRPTAEVIDGMLQTLVDEGFLSDTRYAGAFARDKSALAGWGPVKIRHALLAKGIDEQTIAEALETIDSSKNHDKMIRQLETKARSLAARKDITPSEMRNKLLAYALGRGYRYDDISDLIPQIVRNYLGKIIQRGGRGSGR